LQLIAEEDLAVTTIASFTEPGSDPVSDCTQLAGAPQALGDSGQDFLNKLQDLKE